MLDSLPRNETFNWVDKVSIELTTLMLATLFDFPLEDRRLLTWWSDVATMNKAINPNALEPARAHGRTAARCSSTSPGCGTSASTRPPKTDLVSMLAHGPSTRNMSPLEYMGNLVLLIVGGNDTTRNSMTGGLLALHDHPDQWAKLRANPKLMDSLVPEIIRWQTPLAHMRRTATADIELGGKPIRKGDKVAMWYLSGNRDDSAIEDAGSFHHRPRAAAPAPVVRLRHPPLRGQPPGRAAAAHPVGRDPEALPGDRGRRPAGARALDVRARVFEPAGAHSGLTSGALRRNRTHGALSLLHARTRFPPRRRG